MTFIMCGISMETCLPKRYSSVSKTLSYHDCILSWSCVCVCVCVCVWICPTMKLANFWHQRDYFTLKVLSEGAFKDKNNDTRNFKINWSMVKL